MSGAIWVVRRAEDGSYMARREYSLGSFADGDWARFYGPNAERLADEWVAWMDQ